MPPRTVEVGTRDCSTRSSTGVDRAEACSGDPRTSQTRGLYEAPRRIGTVRGGIGRPKGFEGGKRPFRGPIGGLGGGFKPGAYRHGMGACRGR